MFISLLLLLLLLFTPRQMFVNTNTALAVGAANSYDSVSIKSQQFLMQTRNDTLDKILQYFVVV